MFSYPSDSEKHMLAQQTGLSRTQVKLFIYFPYSKFLCIIIIIFFIVIDNIFIWIGFELVYKF